MIVKLLTEHHLEFLSLKGGCTGSTESTHVKMPHCWKSHALAHLVCKSPGGPFKVLNSWNRIGPAKGSSFKRAFIVQT